MYGVGDIVRVKELVYPNLERLSKDVLYAIVGAEIIDNNVIYAVKSSDSQVRFSIDRFELVSSYSFTIFVDKDTVVPKDGKLICIDNSHYEDILELGAIYLVDKCESDNIMIDVKRNGVPCFASKYRFVYVGERLLEEEEVKECPLPTYIGEDDIINQPSHYTYGEIEPIEYMKAKMSDEEFRGFLKGSVIKYISRAGHKDNELEDYKKAQYYLTRLIKELEVHVQWENK